MPLHPHLHLIADHRAILGFNGTAAYFRDQLAKLRQPGCDKALVTAVNDALDGLDDLLARTLERAQAQVEAAIEAAEALDARMKRLGELRAASQETSLRLTALDSRYNVRDRNYYAERAGIEHEREQISAEWRRLEQSLQADMAAQAQAAE